MAPTRRHLPGGRFKANRASKTAEIAAAVRAAHVRYDTPVVFDDPYALSLVGMLWRTIVRVRPLHDLVFRRILEPLRPVAGQILARARYAEECLEAAIGRGLNQYVIVGAGLDSFALRRRDVAERITVFEVDHPASQEEKRRLMAKAPGGEPPNLKFAPVDFERDSVADALARTPFDPTLPTFFSWLGTTYYLSADAIFTTLRSIGDIAAAGSEIVLDYAIPEHLLDGDERRRLDRLKAFVARRGEPIRTFFEPSSFARDLGGIGFEVLEDLTPPQQLERYFAGRADGLRPVYSSHFAHCRVRRPERRHAQPVA